MTLESDKDILIFFIVINISFSMIMLDFYGNGNTLGVIFLFENTIFLKILF